MFVEFYGYLKEYTVTSFMSIQKLTNKILPGFALFTKA